MSASDPVPGRAEAAAAGTAAVHGFGPADSADARPGFSPLRAVALPAAAAGLTVLLLFLVFESVEHALAGTGADLRLLHFARGITVGVVTAAIVLLVSYRQHRRHERTLEEEVERRGRDAREARTFLQLVVDNTPASLVVLDPGLKVVEANEVARKVHGGELVGHRCSDVLAACSALCSECPAASSLTTGSAKAVERLHTEPRTGEVFTIESHPFAFPDGRKFVLLVERIVTEQRKLQVRLVHQEKMANFGLLAASFAHDLGNPLSSIEAQLQIVDERSLGEENAEVVATVRQEVTRLRRLLREMVDFARRRRDEASLVSVQSAVEDTLRLIRHDSRLRNVRVETEFDRETPPVFVVEDHLMQVVLNLLLNALDAMPDGGTLRLEVAPAGGSVVLRVHDTGHGMDHAVLARCLEPLFTTKAEGRGTGLGLAIARDIVRAAGGEVELHSTAGRGTTAIVTLPAVGPEAAAAAPGEAPRVEAL